MIIFNFYSILLKEAEEKEIHVFQLHPIRLDICAASLVCRHITIKLIWHKVATPSFCQFKHDTHYR